MAKKEITDKVDLDKIAKEDGFPVFVKNLTGGEDYAMYSNEERTMNRVYDSSTGEFVYQYKPKSSTGWGRRFHNPVPTVPVDVPSVRIR